MNGGDGQALCLQSLKNFCWWAFGDYVKGGACSCSILIDAYLPLFLGWWACQPTTNNLVQIESILASALAIKSDWPRPNTIGVLRGVVWLVVPGRNIPPAYGFVICVRVAIGAARGYSLNTWAGVAIIVVVKVVDVDGS